MGTFTWRDDFHTEMVSGGYDNDDYDDDYDDNYDNSEDDYYYYDNNNYDDDYYCDNCN